MKKVKLFKRIQITKLSLTFLSLFLVVALVIGEGVFGWFTNRYESPYHPTIEGADFTLDINFLDGGPVVDLSHGLPVTDQEGLAFKGYEFSIENIGNVPIKINVIVETALDAGPYASNPNLINFREGELRYAFILKDYYFVDPIDPTNTSTTAPDSWMPSHPNACPGGEGDFNSYDCIIDSLSLDIYEYVILPGEYFKFEMRFWIDKSVRILKNKLFYGRIVIESSQADALIISSTAANAPTLVSGMIPVIYDYDLDAWTIIPNYDERWYNYGDGDIKDPEDNNKVLIDARRWANVATVSNANLSKYMHCQELSGCIVLPAAIGEAIPDEEITSMFVWIPRYRFAVRSSIVNLSENRVDIVWEQGTSDRMFGSGKYQGKTPTDFYTPSAFTYGSRELEGFWMSKFQLGSGLYHMVSKAGADMTNNIAEDEWNTRINNQFKENGKGFFGLSYQNVDTIHQIKSSEWDAVAYLSQSRFGKYGKDYLPVMPNTHFDVNIQTTNVTQQILSKGFLNIINSRTLTSAMTAMTASPPEIKTGYVCGSNDLFACRFLSQDLNQNLSSVVKTGSSSWLSGGTEYYTTTNTINDNFAGNSVFYNDPTYGGNGSTTGTIYGVYDMSYAREELMNSLVLQTMYHPHASMSATKTFMVKDVDHGNVYVTESGSIYAANGTLLYETLDDSPYFFHQDFIIHNTIGFDFSSNVYFRDYYHTYSVDGKQMVVPKGSAPYIFDEAQNGISIYYSRVDHDGPINNYISRGGSITGDVEVYFNISVISDTSHSISLEREINFDPYTSNGGIFSLYTTRNPNFAIVAKPIVLLLGQYELDGGLEEFEPTIAGFQIRPSSRAVITM